MLNRVFGENVVPVSVVGLGCSRIGSFNNPVPLSEIRATLDRALALGITLFDTADIYGQGDSERELGRFLKGRHDRAFVVTKVGNRFSAKMRLLRPLKPVLKPLLAARGRGKAVTAHREANIAYDFSAAHIRAAVEGSLRRLQVQRLDGLLLHSPPAAEIEKAEVADVLARLKAEGKVRHFGISCDDGPALEAALRVPGVELLELPLDVIDAAAASELDGSIAERRIGVLAREVIRLQPDVAPAEAVARAAARPGVTSVIVGTSRIGHLEAAVAAVEKALARPAPA